MPDMNKVMSVKRAAKSAREWAQMTARKRPVRDPNIVSIGVGYRYRAGLRTEQICVVFGVKEKRSKVEMIVENFIPAHFRAFADRAATDVQEFPGGFVPLAKPPLPPPGTAMYTDTQSLVSRQRPCPPGFSIGHPKITAGTLGFYFKEGGKWYLVSNNHVIANSNDAVVGDLILQPGPADDGKVPFDHFARLDRYLEINFDSQQGNGKKKIKAGRFWLIARGIPNTIARWVGCPYRLPKQAIQGVVTQPHPNRADAAVAVVLDPEWVITAIPAIGEIVGVRDLILADHVQKTGRTTEHMRGFVEQVQAISIVNYGSKGNATYENQVVVRGDTGDFSAGGDSGSAVLTEDRYLGGLLFAGGGGVTIVNQITEVNARLGITL